MLKPCPFCGEKEKLKVKRYLAIPNLFTITCKACGAEGSVSNSEMDAELQWNIRPERDGEKWDK